jgi:hypothetical protein
MGLHLCAARMAPTTSYEKLIPCVRLAVQFVVLDDQLEFSTREETKQCLDRIIEIVKGAEPLPDENGTFHQMAILRDEFAAFMPPTWMAQFIRNLQRVMKYGIMDEMPYKISGSTPPLEYFMVLREYCVLMYPYYLWAAIESDFVLPDYIDEHPVMMRLMALACRLEAWQNDFHSYAKEICLDSEGMNLLIVLQKQCNMTLEEACTEAKRIHDADLAEFIALHENLPDFGEHQQQVYNYISCLGTILQGINTHYAKDTLRYLPGGVGFAWPEVETANKYRNEHFKLK